VAITNLDGAPTEDANKFTLNLQMNKLVTVNYRMSTTLKQFEQTISKAGEEQDKVKFYSISGARLPLSEKVGNLLEFPILCQVGQNRVFAINFDQELDINNRERTTIKDQEQYFDYAFLLGMRGYGLHSLSNFAHRLQKSLPERQQSLTKTDVNKNIAMTIGYLTSKGIYKGSGDQLSANNFEYLKD
jgi:hypothetical protein